MLGADPGHEMYEGRLCIPFLTRAGVVALKFRCIKHVEVKCGDAGCVKYLCGDGWEPRLYNTIALRGSHDVVVITEGELDALTIHRMVGLPAVGSPGADGWRPYFSRAFGGYSDVVVLADGDRVNSKTGKRAGAEAAKTISKTIPGSRIVYLPEGEDANSLYVKEGREALLARMGLDQSLTGR